MKKVLLAQPIHSEAMALLQNHAEVVLVKEGDLNEFTRQLGGADAVVLGTSVHFTAPLMDLAPQLKVISRTGVGVDTVDVKAATARGILVLNTPEANASSVVEHTVALIFALAKHLVYLDDQTRSGNYRARRMYLPVDLHGKTLGLVGCGRIGMSVAQKCIRAFEMNVMAYDPYLTLTPAGITRVDSLITLFKNADFISIHIPLIESTKNLIDDKLLAFMKPSAFLINTARGGIIDEKALVEKLKRKEIAGAALDVYAVEPPDSSSELLKVENVILTPHTAALTKECAARVAKDAVEGIVDYFQGRTPKYVYNKEVLV
jgi:D-3-phosphoglycerate dehydrogenase